MLFLGQTCVKLFYASEIYQLFSPMIPIKIIFHPYSKIYECGKRNRA